MERRLMVLGLFSGIGGFELGMERSGHVVVGMCEVEPYCRRVLSHHWPDVPLFDDVCKLTGDVVRDRCGEIDLICGGFPCQDISLAGRGSGLAGDRSGLWYEMHRVISEVRPPWVLAENVAALRSRGLGEVLRGLAAIGYDAAWHCIPASAVGAPHERDRVWIIASRSDDDDERCAAERLRRVHDGIREALGDDAHRRDSAFAAAAPYLSEQSKRESTDEVDPLPEGRSSWAKSGRGGQSRPHHHQDAQGGRVYRSARMSSWWQAQPGVDPVVHGISTRLARHNWMHRLHAVGNAVVPQIVEMIGRKLT